MSHLALYLLGAPRLELDGDSLHISRRKVVALLAYLDVEGGSWSADASALVHSRDALATLLWPEHDQSRARAYLRRALSELNRALGGEFLVIDRETAGLKVSADPSASDSGSASGPMLWLDVGVFRERVAACETHGYPPAQVCPECLSPLTEAVELYRDDFLAGFTLRDSPDFDEWQFFQTEGLRRELASALDRLVRWHSAQREFERAILYTRRWVALDPLHEPAHRHLMGLYAQAGQRAAALRQYAECQRVLEEELGVPPHKTTEALYERIRTGAADVVETALVGLTDGRPIAHNLPTQPAPFVGQEAILAQITQLLQNPSCRLLALLGPGGIGKARR